MANCPICNTALRTVRQRDGIFFYCDSCRGRAVTVAQVRRVAGDRFGTELLRRITSAPASTERRCPFCQGRMKQFQTPAPPLTLDGCRPCGVVWFDATEFEMVPESGLESAEALVLRGQEALAMHKVESLAEQARAEDATPDQGWKWIPGLLGLPVELDTPGLTRWPLVTWILSAVILLASLWAFKDLERAVRAFGFIPAQWWRYGGLTSLTSFFLHAGVFHLLSNLYFLLLVGDNVEDFLGRWRFGLLLLLAAVAGDVTHLLADPRSALPCVGASGGIAGVMAFYALKFPRARLGVIRRYGYGFFSRYGSYAGWIQFPAWGAFALWAILQLVGAYEQIRGFGQVSSMAHLGGVAVGVAAWLLWRKM